MILPEPGALSPVASAALPELNHPQADAVAHVGGPLLVFAGAGSGKTRVITYRIANLVARERVAPWRILAVTFTNKAAGEMRHRLEHPDMLGPVARDLWVGTFHATCAKFLRLFPDAIERTKSFVIYDTTDQKAVMTRALRDLDLDDRRYPPKQVLARVHKEKQEGRGPGDMSLDSYMDDVIKKAYRKYEDALRAANALDFEDLILGVVRILEAPADGTMPVEVIRAKETLQKKFDYVLVDEFQDTNQIQYRLIKQLVARTRNVCVVGDDDQSIYRWRGADVRNIRGFRKDYPDAKVVKLEQNYRSSKRIVAGALGVIAPSRTREPKELWTDNDDGSPIRVVACADERDEAACVVRTIKDARDAGISPKSVAVFYRVHAQSRVLEEALRAVDMPYQIIGGTKFYERAEIKDAIAYLRVLRNPRSDVDMMRIINTPARGIGNTTVERVATYASTQGIAFFEALQRIEDFAEDLGTAPRKRLGQFRELLNALIVEQKDRPPADTLRMILAKSGYKTALEAEDTAEAEGRLENLAELEGSMHDYAAEAEARGEVPSLDGFLERVSLQSDTDNLDKDGVERERVTLMTVHGAKGLEFDLVMLTGMEEDMFPYQNQQEGRGAEEMEEERRLAYVAVTRARKHLVVTHTRLRQIFGITRMGTPSRFVGDLPPDTVEHLETPAARAAGGAGRWIDRGGDGGTAPTSWRSPRSGTGTGTGTSRGGWRHPQAAGDREPGERFVEYEESGETGEGISLQRGMSVQHEKFGRGEVLKLVSVGEPAVVAFFPGWGEKKVLARFLKDGVTTPLYARLDTDAVPGGDASRRDREALLGEKYRIERVVGLGGMAAVLAAHHVGLKRDVAIKILLPRFTRHAEVGPRFEREGLAAASLKSPHVAQVMDVGRLPNGDTYLVMELLNGTDLAEVIREKAPLPVAEAVQYLLDACDAIEEAHSLKIIHRDLKPANLFCIAKTGSRRLMVKVLDFGISKAPVDNHSTDVKTTMGTPPYMAPEQFQSAKSADARSDIWALGVILYECLTAMLPFRSAEFVPLALEIAQAPHAPVRGIVPDLSQAVEDVITKCLAKDPAHRFQDVTSLISALTALLEKPKKPKKPKKSEPVKTVIDEVIATPEPKPKRRNTLGIVVAAGCGAIALAWVFARGPNTVEKEAASGAPPTSPKDLAAKCEVTLEVTDVPLKGQVLLRMGQTPVDVERLPVGTRVELVATAEGYSPRRAVIPADAAWIDGRLDLAIQLSPTKAKPGSVDPWPVAEAGAQPGGSGSRGVAHVTSNVGGSEVWLLAGDGPEARIEHLRCTADIDVLVAAPPQLRTRLQVTVKDIEAAGNYASTHRLLRISTLPPTPGTDEGFSLSELLFKADDAHRGGHSLRAKHFYEGALKKSPENLDALTSLGDMALAENDPARAKAMHSKAVAAKPGFRPALLGLADAEWELGEKDAAEKHYAEHVRSGPGSPPRAINRSKR